MKRSAKVRDLDIVKGKLSRQVGVNAGLLRETDEPRRRAAEEARQAMFAHAQQEHPDILAAMTPQQVQDGSGNNALEGGGRA